MSSIPPSTNFTGSSSEYLHKVYAATSATQSRNLYDSWASSYDRDLKDEQYASPELAVAQVVKHLNRSRLASPGTVKVLDAGCGTGLVGKELITVFQAKATGIGQGEALEVRVDGIDISEGMLEEAKKTLAYGELKIVDMSKANALEGVYEEESFDVVTCVGTFTKGHVGSEVLHELVRVVRRGGGLVVATVLEEVWEDAGFRSVVVDVLERFGRVEVLGMGQFGVRKGVERGARMVVLRRKYRAEEIAHAGIGA